MKRVNPAAFYWGLWNSMSERKQHYLSRLFSRIYQLSISRYFLGPYCRFHRLDESYLARYVPPNGSGQYLNFQGFFSRKLAAPAKADAETCWPCDGLLCESAAITEVRSAVVKGTPINPQKIFEPDGAAISSAYWFVNVFLHNRHYHRIHAPVSGVLSSISRIPGKLTVLRPWLNGSRPSAPAFVNERLNIQIVDRSDRVWFLSAVGGPGVGTIDIAQDITVGKSVEVADELACFSLGSSCCLAAPIPPQPLVLGAEVKLGACFAQWLSSR
jgi:phosphatidylserine decarboxylase